MRLTHVRTQAHRWCAALLVLLLAVSLVPTAAAQTDARYFPETGHWLKGSFRAFWERNGGLAVFGYPTSEEFISNSTCQITQYFERARFELRADGSVALGLIGTDASGGRLFPEVPAFAVPAGTRYFPETKHTLKGLFRQTWEAKGGLAIFGYPISEEIYDRTLEDGQFHLVQWFQRGRFELWPEGVRFSRLGAYLTPMQLRLPWPANLQPSSALNEDGFPRPPASSTLAGAGFASVGVTPSAGETGTRFTIQGEGFAPGERVLLYRTSPDQEVYPFGEVPVADGNGSITGANINFGSGRRDMQGIWYITGQGLSSGRIGVGAYRLGKVETPPNNCGYTGGGETTAPPSSSGSLRVSPGSGAIGQTFVLEGEGYAAREGISIWLTSPSGEAKTVSGSFSADKDGRLRGVEIGTSGFAAGRWSVTAQGRSSGHQGIVTFDLSGNSTNNVGSGSGSNLTVAQRLAIPLQTAYGLQGSSTITPLAAPSGISFTYAAGGFGASEQVSVWLTAPNGDVEGVGTVGADGNGAVSVRFTPKSKQEGDWKLTAQGTSTGRAQIAPFKVTRDYVAPLGTARPNSSNGQVSPAEGGLQTRFVLTATGFRANETLDHWITSPDGVYLYVGRVQADSQGRVGYTQSLAVQFGSQNATGIYGYHYRGITSGAQSDLYLTFTGAS